MPTSRLLVVIAFGGSFILTLWRSSTLLGPRLPTFHRRSSRRTFKLCFQMLLQKTWTSPRRSSFACEESRSNRWQAFATKNNSAYAGATRLQGVDSLDEDSILVNLCAVDDRALISEVINDSSRVNTGIDETSTSIMETSGGLFNLTPEPPPPTPDDDGASADEEGGPSPLRKFQVQRSNVLLGSRDAEFYGAAFPEFTKKWS